MNRQSEQSALPITEITIAAKEAALIGDLAVPSEARGLVIFAHGSGSGRHSPRNRSVARALQDAGIATLLADLLTADEEAIDARTGHLRFDIELLADRLAACAAAMRGREETKALTLGYFGASTGAAAALRSAATLGKSIGALVSRGGRPDLARDCLADVTAPTLLIVGGDDVPIIPLNQDALDALRSEKQLVVIPGATHLFEEPGALEEVSRLASDWFVRHLRPAA